MTNSVPQEVLANIAVGTRRHGRRAAAAGTVGMGTEMLQPAIPHAVG